MLKKLMYGVLFLCILGAVAIASLGTGYFAHREQIQPVFDLGERAITRLRRDLQLPTETHGNVRRLETTYLTLTGQVYLMPDQQFRNGGALALWGEDVIVLHSSGLVMVLDEDTGLNVKPLGLPENNLEAYIELAATEYPDQIAKDGAIRYNDLEFIDSAEFRGFLISYTYIDVEAHCYRTRIAKLPVSDSITSIYDLEATPDDWEIAYESNPCLEFNASRELIVGYMAGGRMAFKAPNLVYLGNGEFHREGIYRPDSGIQDDNSDYGKTIEINLTTGEYRHYSKGHRNLQGVTLDAQGRLWTTEHGMRGGDELNLIRDQENYGWPLENLGTLYSGIPAPSVGGVGRHEVYEAPVYAWLPSAAVSSLALIDGFHEAWDKDLLIGSLRGETLFRARIRDERIVFMEPIPIGVRIRDVMQVAPDKIALWTDTEEVVILKVVEREDPLSNLVAGLTNTGMALDDAEVVHEILTGCAECHAYEDNIHGAGPSLYKLSGRDIASTAFAGYSDALKSTPGTWSEDNLTAYLADPGAFAEGTGMSGLGVGDADVARNVAKGFEVLSAQ